MGNKAFFYLISICITTTLAAQTKEKQWMLGPFERPVNTQPVLQSDSTSYFVDPMTQKKGPLGVHGNF